MATICNPRVEDAVEQKEFEDYLFSDQIRIGRWTFNVNGEISRGGNGIVYRLEDPVNRVNMALKVSNTDEEAEIAERMKNAGCNILRMKTLPYDIFINNTYYNNKNAYLMELADGTLYHLFQNILPAVFPQFRDDINQRRETVLNLIEQIRSQIICLRNIDNNRYIYTDLKPTNVLFKCRDQANLNSINVMLGDLGSAVPAGNPANIYVSTYIAPEFRMQAGGNFRLLNDNQKYAYLSWQLGMLILYFFLPDVAAQNNYNRFTWNNVIHSTDADALALRTRLRYFFGPTIGNLVHPDPLQRTDINNPIYPSPDPLPVIPNVVIPPF